jgi:hypothetical protein
VPFWGFWTLIVTGSIFGEQVREGIPKNFVRDVRRERGISSLFETLKGREKLEGRWTVLGLARELGVSQSRIYRLIHNGTLATERHPTTGRYLITDDPELIAGLRKRLTANERT